LPGKRNDVPQIMQALDVFVLPSQAEGISNTILEAMACGLPVVATDVGGNSELVVDGETGTLVPPGDPSSMADAMARYAQDQALRKAHGQAAQARIAEHFSMQRMLSAYDTVYQQLMEQRGLAPG
jgi:glycosyltransferase involved in cell wall biosynthesis